MIWTRNNTRLNVWLSGLLSMLGRYIAAFFIFIFIFILLARESKITRRTLTSSKERTRLKKCAKCTGIRTRGITNQFLGKPDGAARGPVILSYEVVSRFWPLKKFCPDFWPPGCPKFCPDCGNDIGPNFFLSGLWIRPHFFPPKTML